MEVTQEGTATMSAIDIVPLEIWAHVFLYLQKQDVLRMRLVSRYFRDCSHRPKVIGKLTLHLDETSLLIVKEQLESGASGCNMITLFKRLHVNRLHDSSSLEFVLSRIGAQIEYLQLKDSPVFTALSGKLPNLRTLVVQGEYNNSDVQNLDMCTFRQLEAVDLSHKFLTTDNIRCILNRLQGLRSKLTSLSVVCTSSAVEDAMTGVLQLHAATLQALSIQFQDFMQVNAKAEWQKAFRQMRGLRQLELEGNACGFVEDLLLALSDVPLECLLLDGIADFQDHLLELSVHQWRDTLHDLKISYCAYITDAGFIVLNQIRQRLRRLEISHCFNIWGSGLLKGIADGPNNQLCELNLSDNSALEASYLCRLISNLTQLEVLRLANCHNAVKNSVLSIICANLTRLKRLDLDGAILITNAAMMKCDSSVGIANLRDLEELSLMGCQNVTDATLSEALKFRKLRRLDLRDIPRISVRGVERLVKNCPALEELSVNRCRRITNDKIHNIIRHSPVLNYLSLSDEVVFSVTQIESIRRLMATRLNI